MSSSPSHDGDGRTERKKKKKVGQKQLLRDEVERLNAELRAVKSQQSGGQKLGKTLSAVSGIASPDYDHDDRHYDGRHSERRSRRDDQVENQRVEAPASTIIRADMAIEVQVAHNIMTDTPEKEV